MSNYNEKRYTNNDIVDALTYVLGKIYTRQYGCYWSRLDEWFKNGGAK